ncbi:MAG TPA: HD domain-containing protein [bacterium]|nr:HD domain-containing protein [bacterium]
MRNFALTYPQLMNQALAQGFEDPVLRQLREAHDLALKFFDGFYRAQGIPLLNHLVRTASIVLAEKQPVEMASAALLHSAYMFDAPASRRKELKQKLGDSVEALVNGYTNFPWRQEKAVANHLENFSHGSAQTRQLLLIRLANELEDHLDDSMVYRGAFPYADWISSRGRTIVELARKLELKELALELEEAFKATLSRKLPETIKSHCRDAYELPEHRRARLGLPGRIGHKIKRWIMPKKSV